MKAFQMVRGYGVAALLSSALALTACGDNATQTSDPDKQQAALDAQGDALAAQADADAKSMAPSAPQEAIDTIGYGKANLKSTLKDPDSAKFRSLFVSKLSNGGLALCGEVNAKNAFGGFTGFKRFIASSNPDAPTIVDGETTGYGDKVDRRIFPAAYKQFCSNSIYQEPDL